MLYQIDKVDNDYFRKSNRIDMAEETKVHATKQEWLAYAEKSPAGCQLFSGYLSCILTRAKFSCWGTKLHL